MAKDEGGAVTAKIDSLSVASPSCGAEVGARCWSGRQLTCGHYVDRRRVAAGSHVPESFQMFLKREICRVEDEVMSRRKP